MRTRSTDEIEGFEFDWLASDADGAVAFFSTAGARMSLGITMTTEIQSTVSMNLFEPNDALVLPAWRGIGGRALAAVTVVTRALGGARAGRSMCLAHIHAALTGGASGGLLRLFVAHSAWQPDTAFTRKRGLWESLRQSGLALPRETGAEVQVDGPAGVKLVGAALVREDEVAVANDLVWAEPASLMILANDDAVTCQDLLRAGWARENPAGLEYWRDVADVVVSRGAALLRPFGMFDDREAGCDILLAPEQAEHVARVLEGGASKRKNLAPVWT